jgi:hypothetical protein
MLERRAADEEESRMTSQDDEADPQRRDVLKCVAWAGGAIARTITSGLPRSQLISGVEGAMPDKDFTCGQISNSHLGFNKATNPDTTGTLNEAPGKTDAMQKRQAYMINTGDISHLSMPAQFDTVRQLMSETKLATYTVPGEHDILEEDGKSYLSRFGKGSKGDGWYSFDVSVAGLTHCGTMRRCGGRRGTDVSEVRRSRPMALLDPFPFRLTIAGIAEICCAFGGRELL